MNILKKPLAPITGEAWEEIEDQARRVLGTDLSARKFVNIDGPKGLKFSSVPRGELIMHDNKEKSGINYGIHAVQPLIEVRAPFHLDIWELDNVNRGAEDIDLENLEKAAKEIARFEEKAVYYGLKEAGIKGMKESSSFGVMKFPENPSDIMNVVARGIAEMRNAAVEGPYSLVVDVKRWEKISSYIQGYPLRLQLEKLLGGSIILAPHIREAFLVSELEDNFTLTVGQDMSIGYENHDNEKVYLYFTESFTFQVLEPAAVMLID